MKIIHKYIIREFFESLLFGLLVFSCILLLDQIFQLINLVLSKGVQFLTVVKLFLLILPNIFSLTIPMAVLFGILLAFGRLSEDNEITALRSSGMKYSSFTLPVLAITAVLSLFLIFFNLDVSPLVHKKFRQLYQEILTQRPLIKFEEGGITRVGEYRLYVKNINKKTNTLFGVNIYKFSSGDAGQSWRISANSAKMSVSGDAAVLILQDGIWQRPNPARPENLVHMKFSSYQFVIPLGSNVIPFSQSLREMNRAELLKEIDDYRAKKLPTYFLENEYWMRLVLALAPIVFAVVAVPLGILTERGGRTIGFGLSLLVLFGYYLLLVTGINVGEKGYLEPRYILWLPNVSMLVLGVFFWKKMVAK